MRKQFINLNQQGTKRTKKDFARMNKKQYLCSRIQENPVEIDITKTINIMVTKTGTKYIICDVATSKYGKTTFLKKVASLLKAYPGCAVTILAKHWRRDECFVWTDPQTGKTILVQTQGDLAQSFKYTLKHLNTNDIDIILCARHTHGQTANIVQQIAQKYHYEELDFTHMYPQNFNWSMPKIGIAHRILSQALYNLILNL